MYSVDAPLKVYEENGTVYCEVSTDGINHGSVKMFPVIIQYFNWKNIGLQSKLIEIWSTPNETDHTIAQYVKETFEKNITSNEHMLITNFR